MNQRPQKNYKNKFELPFNFFDEVELVHFENPKEENIVE